MDKCAFHREQNDKVVYYTAPCLSLYGMKHGFSTRFGGVSTEDHLKEMNLGFFRGEPKEQTIQNYEAFATGLGLNPQQLVFTNQTHTTNVVVVDDTFHGIGVTRPPVYFPNTAKEDEVNEVDALVTSTPGVAIGIRIADCVPILFCDPQNRVIGAAHAGWRGTVGKIAANTIAQMRKLGAEVEQIRCGIGPAICVDCYEVDDAFHDRFRAVLGDVLCDGAFLKSPTYSHPEKYHCDLGEINARILCQAGILPQHISIAKECTCCMPQVFHSHRASGGVRGTNGAVISLI